MFAYGGSGQVAFYFIFIFNVVSLVLFVISLQPTVLYWYVSISAQREHMPIQVQLTTSRDA